MRHARWLSLITGGMMFGMAAQGCSPDLRGIAAQGTADLLTAIFNSIIENSVNGVFNVPNLGNFGF